MTGTRLSSRIAVGFLCSVVCLSVGARRAHGAQVVYLVSNQSSPQTDGQIEAAARFYGIPLDKETLSQSQDAARVFKAVGSASTLAVVIEANALSVIPQGSLLSAIRRTGQSLPVLIAGINPQTDAASLRAWSGGAISEGGTRTLSSSVWEQIGPPGTITRQLAGARLPLNVSSLDSLTLSPSSGAESLISASVADHLLPLFARTSVGAQQLFFSAEIHPLPVAVSADPFRQQAIFAGIAAPMMFMRWIGGDRAWHSPGDYANFTIDDLWLREPYGHVNYEELLAHSQGHNFHATIAFIPWNYDRSQAEVAALFRSNPDRLSICVHGNDHIHQEFGPLETHPLATQARNIHQSLARMNRFTELTSIPFDRVMVFPHSVSPEQTFMELKRANYLGTANSLNVPSDAAAPSDIDFALRTATLAFESFPSLRRYSAETQIPRAQLAIDAFLGNPLLFYAHESYFATGSNAFDQLADSVNSLQPDLKWSGLGEIMQHLYLQKMEDDGSVSIRAYSPSLRIHNDQRRDTIYHLEKEEDFHLPITVLVDGQNFAYQRTGTSLIVQLPIQRGATRSIEIRYGTPGAEPTVRLSSYSPTAAPIRYLSDFRDNFVSNSSFGRWFIRSYVDFGSRWRAGALFVAAALGFATFAWQRRKRVGRKPQPVSRVATSQ